MSSTTKRQQSRPSAGAFPRKQTVSALLIFLNIIVLLAVVYVLVHNKTNTGNAAASAHVQSCASAGGYGCMLGLDCQGQAIQAADAPLCCTAPCTPMPRYKLDLNTDGVIDRNDLALLVQHMHATQGDPLYNPLYDLTSDGTINARDIAAWGKASGPLSGTQSGIKGVHG